MVDLIAPLHRHFGHTAFRPGQEDLVRAVLDGRDVLAVMPTGSGKSLGFQLPALLLPGTTLVVSPLLSLMKDQVDELNRRGIRAAALHSMLSGDARREILSSARSGDVRLLYVAPERFASDHFVRTLRDLPVARFVVDEAHCVSAWGHDFRPDYRRLRQAAAECRRSDAHPGRPPIAAFTATATPEVRDDIVDLLGLAEPQVIVAGFDRPNIELRVRPVTGELEKRQLVTELVGHKRALVYAATRRNAESAAEALQTAGHQAAAYHAGLGDADRTRVQDHFASGALLVVCATNAFGMGIDRPDVEAVVHIDIPGSLEAYYQEIGRAGRDARPAIATLLWNYADVKTREFLINHGRDESPARPGVPLDPAEAARRKELEHRKLRRMVAYADSAGCLRATILRYFGDPAAREPCGACGNCDRRAPLDADTRLLVRKILSGIARGGERYGRRRIAAMLIGNVDDLPEPLTRLSTTGLLRNEQPRTIERWIDAACGAGLIGVSEDQYRTLGLTPLGRDVMAGRVEDVRMAVPLVRQPLSRRHASGQHRVRRRGADRPERGYGRVGSTEAPGVDEEGGAAKPLESVVATLRAWRLEEARKRAIAPFVILHDRTLVAIATTLPRSSAELHAVPGIGPAKLAAYGDAILAVIESIVASVNTR
ncbi:MAG: ATP-dependent DNA helicase RecQ [Acidobacteria bacterium]|nr:ATP-dependent DNA helicase RecQ [Acidobacteriota bacterium]